ncbi:MAG: flavin reductase family protein [Proteobacteria bacterium]|nr:flavin reductase family protein [Pseudomonadota bacterium]
MKIELSNTPLLLPLPTVLVATYGKDDLPNAMTASWASPCNANPPCIGVAIRHSRTTYDNIRVRRGFTINIPTAAQATATDYLGLVSGRKEPDKVARAGFHTARASVVDAPLLAECPLNIELSWRHELDMGCHIWVVGEVQRIHAVRDITTEDGHIDATKLAPLVYLPGVQQYVRIGDVVDKAFSCGRSLKGGA